MTVANIRYNHMAAPWDAPLSFGKQALIEYNGLILNDRYQEDKIRVTGLTGIDDAEVRDAREAKSGAHGEIPYDAFYGGRNIVLTGSVEAGSLAVFNSLVRDLKAAFAPLQEAPLKFRWFDIEDNFDDPQSILPYHIDPSYYTSGNYEALTGSNYNFAIENGFLQWKNPGKDFLIRAAEQRVFSDVQSTIRINIGTGERSSYFSFIFAVIDAENYVKCTYNQNEGEPYIAVQVVVEGTTTTLEKATLPVQLYPEPDSYFYFRGRKEGDTLVAEFWNNEPSEYNLPQVSVNGVLEGREAEVFGSETLGPVGFGGSQIDTNWRFDRYKIESIYPGDVIFNARKISSLSLKEEPSQSKFKGPFQITMKASDFRAFNPCSNRKTIVPESSGLTILGRSYKRKFPDQYKQFVSTAEQNNLVNIENKGNVFTEPVIVAYGPLQNLSIRNLKNNLEVSWIGEVPLQDFIAIDVKNKTVTNSNGQNKQNGFSSSNSAWMVLEPGSNDLVILGNSFSSNESYVTVFWKHAYI